ncbi:unnamed protein product [Boreogadus saida]
MLGRPHGNCCTPEIPLPAKLWPHLNRAGTDTFFPVQENPRATQVLQGQLNCSPLPASEAPPPRGTTAARHDRREAPPPRGTTATRHHRHEAPPPRGTTATRHHRHEAPPPRGTTATRHHRHEAPPPRGTTATRHHRHEAPTQ